jgi:hypothetical protein
MLCSRFLVLTVLTSATCSTQLPEKALVSLYKPPGGGLVVAVTNRLPHDKEVSVQVDLAKLGLTGRTLTATDERTEQSLDVQNGRFAVPVKGRSYTLVSLRAR